MSMLGICTAKVAKWRCMRGVMLKEPAVGFMHAEYWMFVTSFKTILTCVHPPTDHQLDVVRSSHAISRRHMHQTLSNQPL